MDWNHDYRTSSPLGSLAKILCAVGLVLGVYMMLAKLDIWHHPRVDRVIDKYAAKIKSL